MIRPQRVLKSYIINNIEKKGGGKKSKSVEFYLFIYFWKLFLDGVGKLCLRHINLHIFIVIIETHSVIPVL